MSIKNIKYKISKNDNVIFDKMIVLFWHFPDLQVIFNDTLLN